MFKKFFLILFALSFLFSVEAQESDVQEPGALFFRGELFEEQYILRLNFEENLASQFKIKAIKITYEPSGTVAALIYDENCKEEEVQYFLDNKESLSLLKVSSFLKLNPVIYYYPKAQFLAKEDSVKVEYFLAGENEEIIPIYGGKFAFDEIFSLTVEQGRQN